MAVDILPASVPLDASRHFSNALEPYLAALIEEESGGRADSTKQTPHQAALTRATIASAGVLAPKHSWLQSAVDQVDKSPPAPAPVATSDSEPSSVGTSDANSSNAPPSSSVAADKPLQPTRRIKKKILMLGSGMVAQPAVDMIALSEGVELVIGQFFLFVYILFLF